MLQGVYPPHTGIFQKAMLSTSEIFIKKMTTSNFKMAFTKVLDKSLKFNILKTKISCDIWFAFESAKKEWICPNLPCKLDNVKNFASKRHRI